MEFDKNPQAEAEPGLPDQPSGAQLEGIEIDLGAYVSKTEELCIKNETL